MIGRESDCAIYDELIDDQARLEAAGITQIHLIGDAHTPGIIAQATFAGHRLAREIDQPNPDEHLPFIRERRLVGATEDDYRLGALTLLPRARRDPRHHRERRMTEVRLLMVLTENDALIGPRDLGAMVEMAVEAERHGIDGVMLSEHVVLGRDSGAAGPMQNPRDYAAPGNQEPSYSWPNSLVLMSAIAQATERLRIVAGAIIGHCATRCCWLRSSARWTCSRRGGWSCSRL